MGSAFSHRFSPAFYMCFLFHYYYFPSNPLFFFTLMSSAFVLVHFQNALLALLELRKYMLWLFMGSKTHSSKSACDVNQSHWQTWDLACKRWEVHFTGVKSACKKPVGEWALSDVFFKSDTCFANQASSGTLVKCIVYPLSLLIFEDAVYILLASPRLVFGMVICVITVEPQANSFHIWILPVYLL